MWGTEIIFYIQTNLINGNTDSKNSVSDSCGVCGNDKCKRHRRSHHLNPVAKVPKSFDTALEQVLFFFLSNFKLSYIIN